MLHNLDSDSSKIIEAVRSTGVVITEAMRLYVDYIVSNMKAIGTWDLCNAVYGFVGGTAASHKWNWKDLRDVDTAFRLTYVVGVTHSANGMQGNGTTGYANTNLSANLQLSINSTSLILYTNSISVSGTDIDLGFIRASGVDRGFSLSSNVNASGLNAFSRNYTFPLNGLSTTTITKGVFISNRTSSTDSKLFVNGSISATNTTANTYTSFVNMGLTNLGTTFFLLGENQEGSLVNPSPRPQQFASIGAGLTDTQAIQQSQIVTNAQNILNRA